MAAAAGYAAGRPGRPGYQASYGQRRPPAPSLEGLALADDEELVAGRRPVEEAFVARREARRLLVVPQRRMALEKLVLHATNLRIPVVEVEGGSLTAIAGFDGHQGIALVVAPRRWATPDDILALARQRDEAPLVLVLDSLEDPQNVGTLLRTAEAQGVHGAIFPTHRQAPLTPAAVKASAGAVEHLQLAPVDDLAGALADLHVRGLRVVGADGDAPLTAREADLRGPVAIVVGSEGRGLGPAVRRRCDLLVRIPMHGRIDSLNAAVAGSILLYEAAAQRGLVEAAPRPEPEPSETTDAIEPAERTEASPATAPAATADPAAVQADPEAADSAPPEEPKRRATRKRRGTPSEPTAPAAGDQPEAEVAPAATTPRRRRSTKVTASPTPPDDADELLPGGPPVDVPAESAEGVPDAANDAPQTPGEV
jgi:23S rRNA (guanosine2251-2'-O)-methyltransferase